MKIFDGILEKGRRAIWCLVLGLWCTMVDAHHSNTLGNLHFEQYSALNGLSCDDVQKVYQDREGFIWLATRFGISKYDGYRFTHFQSNYITQGLLTCNNVLDLADDNDGNIWIATLEGLNRYNKYSGEMARYKAPQIPDDYVSCLLVTRSNEVWIGTDGGVCRYESANDSLHLFTTGESGGAMLKGSVKSLYEDTDGDIWIGTWNEGLYRYSHQTDRIYAYPRINEQNSAHTIYQDSRGTIWVGGWDSGLYRIDNPKDMKKTGYTNYRHQKDHETSLADNRVYDISEDSLHHKLWIGTRSGLSLMELDNPGHFTNYHQNDTKYDIPCDEINSLLFDRWNNIWMGTIGGGVWKASLQMQPFKKFQLDLRNEGITTSSVRAIFADADGNLWVGAGSYGLALYNTDTEKAQFYSHLPEFAHIKNVPTINDIIQRPNGEIWFATYDGGILIYRKGQDVKVLNEKNTDFLYSHNVTALTEDSRGNLWAGCRGGMGISYNDGSSYHFGDIQFEDGNVTSWYAVEQILEDVDGSFWIATANMGLIHITGDIMQPKSLKFEHYGLENSNLSVNNILSIANDRLGRLWVGTEGGGLYLFDRKQKQFLSRNIKYNITSEIIASIETDKHGCLWMGTNRGIVRLEVPADETQATIRKFTTSDGLTDKFFHQAASCRQDEFLWFGGSHGFNRISPLLLNKPTGESVFFITDIKIFNRSLSTFPQELRRQISDSLPPYTDHIELPYHYNNLSFEFATLSYKNTDLNRYAYKLEGVDKDWQWGDANQRFAYYNNLKSGTYHFLLRAADENGIWNNRMRQVKVVILPPFWATWWAYSIYLILAAITLWMVTRIIRNRILLRNQLRLHSIERSKLEEMNHTKLQFFTNITHELLTPLTIISATVEELKLQVPDHDDLYQVLGNNIRRLIRLLQQILEFRKAETGNLKLRVSPGDVAAFIKNVGNSFFPLIKKRKIHFSVVCDPEQIMGYFDTDKLDKIVYNLLSNAAKYNKEGGYIQVTVKQSDDKKTISLHVKDNGCGIAKECQKDLFKRFYEGEYRQHHTIGTGIGLSLTRDLVRLHGGEISVESDEGKGAEFIVKLPITRESFEESQIDEDAVLPIQKTISYYDNEKEMDEEKEIRQDGKHRLLVVEDNEELLQLMVRLLGREYCVFTATQGEEAIKVLNDEDVDLIVSDVMMPGIDGIELCKYVKNRLETSHIPLILLTAKNREEDRAEAYEVGADGFITKPFNLSVLHAKIKNLLKYKERQANDFKKQLVFEMKDLNYTSMDEEFLQRAIDTVNRHLDDCTFDHQQFAEEMGASRSTVFKKLKSLTGLNTSAFIRNIRFKAACTIMEQKGSQPLRVSELAYAVGFNDPKYFSSCFKKEFGMLPAEYKERFVDNIQPIEN